MAILVQDNFDRANNASVVGAPQVGPAPVSQIGTWGINSNLLYCSATTSSRGFVSWDAGTAEVEISAVVPTNPTSVYLCFASTSATDAWAVAFDTASQRAALGRVTNTGFALMDVFGSSPVALSSFTAGMVYKAGRVKAMVNGSQVGPTLPFPYTPLGTLCGLATTVITTRIDSLLVQDAGAVSGAIESTGHVYKGRDLRADDEGMLVP